MVKPVSAIIGSPRKLRTAATFNMANPKTLKRYSLPILIPYIIANQNNWYPWSVPRLNRG